MGSEGRRASVSCTVRMCFARASDRVKERSHSKDGGLAPTVEIGLDWRELTWQGTEERLLSGMATHVGFEGIAARMIHIQPGASFPFADIFLLPGSNVVIVDMLHQHVHVEQIANRTVCPFAHGDLLMSNRIVVLHLRELLSRRGSRHISRSIRRYVAGILSAVIVGHGC